MCVCMHKPSFNSYERGDSVDDFGDTKKSLNSRAFTPLNGDKESEEEKAYEECKEKWGIKKKKEKKNKL